MAAAAGTLYQTGTGLNNASQMVIILEPIVGQLPWGSLLLVLLQLGFPASSKFAVNARCWLTGVIPATKLAQVTVS